MLHAAIGRTRQGVLVARREDWPEVAYILPDGRVQIGGATYEPREITPACLRGAEDALPWIRESIAQAVLGVVREVCGGVGEIPEIAALAARREGVPTAAEPAADDL